MTALALALFYLAYVANLGFIVLYASTSKFWRNLLGRVIAVESLVIAVVYTMSFAHILGGEWIHADPTSLLVNGLVTAMLVYRFGTYAWVVHMARRDKRVTR